METTNTAAQMMEKTEQELKYFFNPIELLEKFQSALIIAKMLEDGLPPEKVVSEILKNGLIEADSSVFLRLFIETFKTDD